MTAAEKDGESLFRKFLGVIDESELTTDMNVTYQTEWQETRYVAQSSAILCVDEMIGMLDTSHLREMKKYLESIV